MSSKHLPETSVIRNGDTVIPIDDSNAEYQKLKDSGKVPQQPSKFKFSETKSAEDSSKLTEKVKLRHADTISRKSNK